MKKAFDLPSLVTGASVAVALVAVFGFRAPAAAKAPVKYEYKMTTKHNDKIIKDLGDDGWAYAGYLGESALGGGQAIGLWVKEK